MKVVPVFNTIRSTDAVREKPDGQNRHPQQQSQQEKNSKEDNNQKFDPKKLEHAIESFETDSQSKLNGLHAFVEGNGPGLKVVLKDGRGAIIRQFTGEEFVQMREAINVGKSRGKILDQKL